METKVCTRCEKSVALEQFGYNAKARDGCQSACRPCVNSMARERRLLNPGRDARKLKEWRDRNREKLRAQQRAYYKRWPGRLLRKRRQYGTSGRKLANQRRVKYGITSEQFRELLARQGGKCAICERSSENSFIFPLLDHCHVTKKIRGILCKRCNLGIGFFQESPEVLRKVLAYLEAESPLTAGV